ncbi:MAG: hypothetical protein NTV49_11775 [Kiritimatiellaeota bacterium]|nr:hypothetical protein [Kiritimatiellota bacterium]
MQHFLAQKDHDHLSGIQSLKGAKFAHVASLIYFCTREIHDNNVAAASAFDHSPHFQRRLPQSEFELPPENILTKFLFRVLDRVHTSCDDQIGA